MSEPNQSDPCLCGHPYSYHVSGDALTGCVGKAIDPGIVTKLKFCGCNTFQPKEESITQ